MLALRLPWLFGNSEINMNNKNVILVGGGGHARSLVENFSDFIGGYLAPEPNESLNLNLLGDDKDAPGLIKTGFLFNIAFVYAGSPSMDKRKTLIDFYKNIGAHFSSLISPAAFISPNSSLASGVAIMPGVIINLAQIGENSIINTGAIIDHDSVIGNNCFIGPGVIMGGFCNVGDNCFIGLGTSIRNGIKIADGVTVGMGSIVTKDITKPGIYYGVI